MHPRTRRRTRFLASATALALLTAPGTAYAVPDPSPHPDAHPGSAAVLGAPGVEAAPGVVDPADKITPGAKKAFAARTATNFWLRFADQPDLSAAGGITSWSERGEYVYDALVAAAESSQEEAVAELEGSGAEYTSYWATNAILVEGGSLDLATDLAANAEVLEIRPTTRYAAPEPVETTAGANEAAAAAGPTWGIAAINADDVWNEGHTGEGIVVANIDSGVDGDHGALSGQYRGRGSDDPDAYNYFSADGRSDPHDDNGHGTHTMGTMVGGTVRNGGADHAVGVAPGAQWIAAAAGDADGLSDEDLIAAGEWILAPYDQSSTDPDPRPALRPHVVNNSWGEDFSTDPFMEGIVQAWEYSGIFATFANGNAGVYGCEAAGSPASRTVNYAVGAFTRSGQIADFSSRGPGQSGTVKPDIAAPGANVLSTLPSESSGYQNGTSMAAPHVAGAVALLWSAAPELVGNVQATRAVLDGTARDVNDTSCGGTADDNNVWGEGKLDVLAAYELAKDEAFDTTTVPTVSGAEYRVGKPLTATVAAWSPAATFTYQWRRGTDGEMIPGATKPTYTPQGADLGSVLSVTAVGSAAGRTPTSTTSTKTSVIKTGSLTASVPRISGTIRVGSTLRALAGSWTSGTQLTYRWYANGAAISGANGFTFTPTAAQRGKRLKVRIFGTRAGYTTASRTSAASAAVPSGVFSQSAPLIIGVAAAGTTLKVSRPQSTPVPSSVAYRWKLDGRSIRGATDSSLSVRSSWRGRKITVTATVRRTGYFTRSVTSAAARVGSMYSAAPNPRISGTVRVGSTLRASTGTWSPKPSFSYRWYANGVPISGATKSTYALKGTDYRKKITVSVRTYRSGYGTAMRRSSATRAVLTPAMKFPGDDSTSWLVGSDSVPPVSYVAQAGSAECMWERYSTSNLLASDIGSGQRIVKVQSTDYAIWSSSSCGTWTKYYAGMVTPRASTAHHGVYVLGDHLERGVYSTKGPTNAGTSCRYAFYKGFYGASGVVSQGEVSEAHTITMPSSARGFETAGCSWKRIG
ncbi:Serine protease, subtilisin family [Promicromonospora umidemergens]|uniref:Peptidase S8/S53 domain-containing protein n=1 Tax=Promicromonospora umidemergens TaxID=629679 RepID=A0ABP8WXU4_9MICO|nr:S8 family serine peptidase [Promicromonospora umidemergens]MCP2283712.1 Serine protease, subtilisin family [Promicromonospora umidemergens]